MLLSLLKTITVSAVLADEPVVEATLKVILQISVSGKEPAAMVKVVVDILLAVVVEKTVGPLVLIATQPNFPPVQVRALVLWQVTRSAP